MGTSREVVEDVGSGPARPTHKFPSSVGQRSRLIHVMPQGEGGPECWNSPGWTGHRCCADRGRGRGTTQRLDRVPGISHSVVSNLRIALDIDGSTTVLSIPTDRYRKNVFHEDRGDADKKSGLGFGHGYEPKRVGGDSGFQFGMGTGNL